MPNWCYTKYHFEGDGKDIKTLYKMLCEYDAWFRKQEPNNRILIISRNVYQFINFCNMNYNYDKTGDDYSCRGGITYYECDDTSVDMDIEDAWCPHPDFWFELVLHYNWDMEISYIAEESMLGLFEKSGSYFTEKYYLFDEQDILNQNISYFESDEDLLSSFNAGIKEYLETVDKDNLLTEYQNGFQNTAEVFAFVRKVNDKYPDVSLSLYEFEEVE